MPDLTPNQTGDLAWLDGYRMRANGKPKPTTPPTTADGWSDLDALLELITRAQSEIDILKTKDEALGARVLKLEETPQHGGY